MELDFRKLKKNEYLKFYHSLREGKLTNSHGCYVSLDAPEYYANTDNFIIGENIGGFAIKDGDLIGVHKNSQKAKIANLNNIMPKLLICAIENGAVKLDCYGEFLAGSYMKYGFIPVGKMDFNVDYNPDWPVEKFGKPKVIAMMQCCDSLTELYNLQHKDELIYLNDIIEIIPNFDDYVLMLKYRDRLLEISIENNLNYNNCIELVKNNSIIGDYENEPH